jgi:hypothetical protein
MKRTLTLLALIATTTFSVFAQNKAKTQTTSASSTEKPRSYLGLCTGINNIAGFAGLTFEVPLSENASAKLGLGLGAWGVKIGLAAKYYKEYASSWSFGAGYSTASGASGVELTLMRASTPTIEEKVKVDLTRSHNLDLVAGKAWGKSVKFSLELGYSVRVGGATFAPVDKNFALSDNSKTVLNVLRPGGLIVGMGLLFRL